MGDAFKENEGDTDEARRKLDELASKTGSNQGGPLRAGGKRKKGGMGEEEGEEDEFEDEMATGKPKGRRRLMLPRNTDPNKMTIRYDEEENEP